jgi:glycosyltransferase involved in cell wall biosynthesis
MKTISTNPRVSIGMPIYNAERYLESTLKTVLAQSYGDFVLYISDNASTDGTSEICKDYAGRDKRIVYIANPENIGAPGNYERCFTPATSEYFRWQNGDDPIEPTLIEECLKVLDYNPDVVLAYGRSHLIDEFGEFMESYEDNMELMDDSPSDRLVRFLNNIRYQNVMYGLIRRQPLSKTALMGSYASSDLNLVGELSLYGKFKEIPIHLFNRRMHPASNSADRKDEEKQNEFWSPSKKKLVMPTWRSYYEYFRAVYKAPISLGEKRKLTLYFMRRASWYRSILWKELVRELR